MNDNKIIGAVEIGGSKVVVMVGEIVNGRSLNIIGMGQSTSMGVKKGEITDFRAASDCTHAAIIAAEKNAGATIEGIYLAQTGRHLEGFSNKSSITVSSPDGLVRQVDIQNIVDNAKRKELPQGRVYIHHIQCGYHLDGRVIGDPHTMQGDELEVAYWHVQGDEKKVSDHIHVINGFGLKVEDMIISSIASGCMVASDEEKQNGVLVLDIGCNTTDYALYRNGHIMRTGVLSVGGDHLTNDLCLGLRINKQQAEKLKLEYGKAIVDSEDKDEKVWLFGDLTIGDRPIPRMAIYQIIKARVDELFGIIKKELVEFMDARDLAGGIILTGGVSRLSKIADAATRQLGVPTRIGENPSWVRDDLRKPEYSTVLGLLYYGLTAQNSEDQSKKETGLFQKVVNIFNL